MLKPFYLKTNELYNKTEDPKSPLEIFTWMDSSFSRNKTKTTIANPNGNGNENKNKKTAF